MGRLTPSSGVVKRSSVETRHDRDELSGASSPLNEGEGQQLISWKLLVCFAIGAAFWLGAIQVLDVLLSETGRSPLVLAVLRRTVACAGLAALGLAALAGLNGALRHRRGPGPPASQGRGARGPRLSEPQS